MDAESKNKILPIAVGAALKSLRNTDFDIKTAICEVIDNSIQADAKTIKITTVIDDSSRRKLPVCIAFGDDGTGMNDEDLQYCLRLGYSGRYDDRKGIGRFGVGMTFGAISLCQKIEVYSRQKQKNWSYTYLDISNTDLNNDPVIAPIQQKDLPSEYKNLVGDFGTLVIWSKIDRVDTSINDQDLVHELGRIYRKFIGEEIIEGGKIVKNDNKRIIYFNQEVIHSHDPLFVTKSTKFPDDEVAIFDPDNEIEFNWSVHDVDAPESGETEGKITIRMSLLPASWRQKRAKVGRAGSGRSKDNLRRKVDNNEGISVLRNGREVAYSTIPYLLSKDKETDRFWGCEINFEPVLDYWFSVRNIKIGARPLKDLKDELKRKINPVVENHFRIEIKKVMDKYDAQENASSEGPIHGHESKEEKLGRVANPKSNDDPDKQKEAARDASKSAFPDDEDKQKDYEDKVSDPKNKYNIIEIYDTRPDNPFFEIIPKLATKTVHYNMNHEFFQSLAETLTKLKKQIEDNDADKTTTLELVDKLRDYFDDLIFAFSEAHYDFDDQYGQQDIKQTLEDLMVKWNHCLRKVFKMSSDHD